MVDESSVSSSMAHMTMAWILSGRRYNDKFGNKQGLLQESGSRHWGENC